MKHLVTIFLIVLSLGLFAQTELSLEQCISYAWEHNLNITEGELNMDAATSQLQESRLGRLPNISANSNLSTSFGRRIDPSTNDFINQSFSNQSISVNGGIMLFDGNRINNQIKLSKNNLNQAELDLEQIKNDIALGIALDYLAILLAEDNLETTQRTLALTRNQIEQTQKLIDAGTRAKNEILDLQAQEATNEGAVILAENDVELAYLAIQNRMNYDGEPFTVRRIDPSLFEESDLSQINEGDVFDQAINWLPSVQSANLDIQSSELQVALAKANYFPSISLGGSLGSAYSSAAQRFSTFTGTTLIPQSGVFINGESVDFAVEQDLFLTERTPYLDQLNENLGYGFGFNLNIPIFNQGSTRNLVAQRQIDVIRAKVGQEQVKLNIKEEVKRALAQAKSAQKSYVAAQRTYEARLAAFQDMKRRYELGVSNSFEFTTAQTNLENAEIEQSRTFYDMIFRQKIVDYYQGKQIKLN